MARGALRVGGSSYGNSIKTHGAPSGGDAYRNTVKNLGGDSEDSFRTFPGIQKLYDDRVAGLRKIVAERHAAEAQWEKENPEKTVQIREWFSGKAPKTDRSGLVQKRGIPTRNGSAIRLGVIAGRVPNMVIPSADLSNSDKTDGFLNKTHAFTRDDFNGAFFQIGVSELAMACICIGMMFHGGVVTAMGTFSVFSDYMEPAIRMAALMQTPVKFVWSHDALRAGEDGPTYEPVEQEAQIQLMKKLQNHAGQDSVCVLRPADNDIAAVCWQMAMEKMDTSTALIFSRQNVNSLLEGTDYQQTRKGAYIVTSSDEQSGVILVVSGSEASIYVAGAELLRKDGVKVRVVSAPSEGFFHRQSKEYQEQILSRDAKIFGLTIGLPVTIEGLVSTNGKIFGLNSFGFSAPYTVSDEKLGSISENVYKQVKAFLA